MPSICQNENCRERCRYAFKGELPQFCKTHKQEGMISNPRYSQACKFKGCETTPSYNFEGCKNRMYCCVHKLDGMINLRDSDHQYCRHEDCNIRASFNYAGKTERLYCEKHSHCGMINVLNDKCTFDGCETRAIYNYKGEKPKYCLAHSEPGMINIKDKKCSHTGCDKIPSYKFENSNAKYCTEHKQEGMFNIRGYNCTHAQCNKRATFNILNGRPKFCKQHKTDDMVDVQNTNRCKHQGCEKHPAFNYPQETTYDYCAIHRKEGMVDIKTVKCPNCIDWPDSQKANKKYKNYCARCFQQLFPDDPLTYQIRCKTKEIATRDYINATFEGFQHDKCLWLQGCDCSHKRRIDHRKLIGNTMLCIETDENQHKYYDHQDELNRYHDCFMALGCKFIFIRFNPDKYKDKNGKSKCPNISTRLFKLKEEIPCCSL